MKDSKTIETVSLKTYVLSVQGTQTQQDEHLTDKIQIGHLIVHHDLQDIYLFYKISPDI